MKREHIDLTEELWYKADYFCNLYGGGSKQSQRHPGSCPTGYCSEVPEKSPRKANQWQRALQNGTQLAAEILTGASAPWQAFPPQSVWLMRGAFRDDWEGSELSGGESSKFLRSRALSPALGTQPLLFFTLVTGGERTWSHYSRVLLVLVAHLALTTRNPQLTQFLRHILGFLWCCCWP